MLILSSGQKRTVLKGDGTSDGPATGLHVFNAPENKFSPTTRDSCFFPTFDGPTTGSLEFNVPENDRNAPDGPLLVLIII